MGIPLRRGREFAETDAAGAEKVAVVNEAFARKYLPNLNPLGQQLQIGRGANASKHLIVGVTGDAKHFGLGTAAPPMMFIPAAQAPDNMTLMLRRFLPARFVLKTNGEPLLLAEAVRQQMREVDATLAVTALRTLEQIVTGSLAAERFNLSLLGLFAGLGLLLAGVGIYGVMSYTVTQHTPELGIRIALGAQRRDVLPLVLGRGMKLVGLGLILGLAAALALTRLLKSLLFAVSATDPLTLGLIMLLLAAVALLACYVPARRATQVDPLVALRSD